ncbi:helix-turn-helix domain-containing protein [Mesobacillus harenae]|uniref:helix-turn-helix domain-containing protein n=1 Tax=Mesobacillus harenae TaxID=2213203 RepID=UPI0015800013|nr:XRE family transcriptional regulator [Mesobacillus harenae]
MENIQQNISRNLRAIRKSRGLSLDQTADLTGVSKGMLGQVERGESNPTVTTLWKIATGLQISFSTLIKEEPSGVHIIHQDQIESVMEQGGDYRVYPIFPFDPRKKFEIFTIEIESGCKQDSDKHNDGVEEYITVISGELELVIGRETYQIPAGSSIRFNANQQHSYHSRSSQMTRFQVVMYYS